MKNIIILKGGNTMNMYAGDLETCINAMELAFARMRWDFVDAFQREGLSVKDIPDDLHDADKAMHKVLDSLRNCDKLLLDLEVSNARKKRKKD
jgi:hypothetical protein